MAAKVSHLGMGWADEALELVIEVDDDGMARLVRLAAGAVNEPAAIASSEARLAGPRRGGAGVPLVDVIVCGSGRAWSGRRYMESVVGQRLRYRDHEERRDGPWRELKVRLEDPAGGLRADAVYRVLEGRGALRSWARLTNGGTEPVTIESVTSFLGTGLEGPAGDLNEVDLLWAENDWLAESRWQRRGLRDALPDLDVGAHGSDPRGRLGLTSVGSWSSGTFLPMGAAVNRRTGHTWVWQIEHNGAWHWQVGEHTGREATSEHHGPGPASAYLALLGPTDAEHQWRLTLGPGEQFETVPVGIALSTDGLEGAVGRLTHYRRAIRRPHQDHRRLPVIFNDYMNTLMGDPTTERLVPLITAAARVGAECFCIDAGWYAETDEQWWDAVGMWEPSTTRFPNGITEVLDLIRAQGMVPGLWLEPEVVGVRSPLAGQLAPGAFFARNGERVVEHGRYHLDLSHPAARRHLDRVVDLLVGDLGVGYLKMDYNINVGPGTASGGASPGAGLLAHNRAYLDWVDAVLDRHPGLTLENCGSGGMRTDYALLSHFQLQSTSDQQDLTRYPAIAAAVPMAVTPEQAAVWAYPQPEWSDDEIAFTLCSALLGRVHLSGHIDRMSPAQQQLVADAISAYKRVRPDLSAAVPFWPLGLPRWTDPWVALGMRSPAATYVVVWHRGTPGTAPAPDEGAGLGAEVVLPVAGVPEARSDPEVLYPVTGGAKARWDVGHRVLTVMLRRSPSACLLRLA
jgi:alpha-galactosidase